MTLDEGLRQRNRDMPWWELGVGIQAACTELCTNAVLNPARLRGYSMAHTKWLLLLRWDISISFSTLGSKLSLYVDLELEMSKALLTQSSAIRSRSAPAK